MWVGVGGITAGGREHGSPPARARLEIKSGSGRQRAAWGRGRRSCVRWTGTGPSPGSPAAATVPLWGPHEGATQRIEADATLWQAP